MNPSTSSRGSVSFKPADNEDLDWAGEAYVDANDFQPICVYTEAGAKDTVGSPHAVGD
jgi:hypothetical protein